jgi:hypothetical protein
MVHWSQVQVLPGQPPFPLNSINYADLHPRIRGLLAHGSPDAAKIMRRRVSLRAISKNGHSDFRIGGLLCAHKRHWRHESERRSSAKSGRSPGSFPNRCEERCHGRFDRRFVLSLFRVAPFASEARIVVLQALSRVGFDRTASPVLFVKQCIDFDDDFLGDLLGALRRESGRFVLNRDIDRFDKTSVHCLIRRQTLMCMRFIQIS